MNRLRSLLVVTCLLPMLNCCGGCSMGSPFGPPGPYRIRGTVSGLQNYYGVSGVVGHGVALQMTGSAGT